LCGNNLLLDRVGQLPETQCSDAKNIALRLMADQIEKRTYKKEYRMMNIESRMSKG
jgi:hypothetical protein